MQVVAQVKKYYGNKVYKTVVPRTVRLSEAPSFGMPINFYEPNGKGSEAIWPWRVNFWKITSGNDLGFPVWEREVCEWQNANWAALAKAGQLFEDLPMTEDASPDLTRLPVREIEPDPDQPRKTLTKTPWRLWQRALAKTACCSPLRCAPKRPGRAM